MGTAVELNIRCISHVIAKGKFINLLSLIDSLRNEYTALYQRAADGIYEFFDDMDARTWKTELDRRFRQVERYYGPEERTIGDIFSYRKDNNLYYACIDIDFQDKRPKAIFEIGVFGYDVNDESLQNFQLRVGEFLQENSIEPKWRKSVGKSRLLNQLLGTKTASWLAGTKVTKSQRKATNILLEPTVFKTAMWIKKSQGILAKDLEEAEEAVRALEKSGLVSKEYVVICKSTSRQVNRVKSKKDISEMKRMKILCSCGRPIEEENVEELYAPTSLLSQMLDSSFWMSVKVIDILVDNGVNPKNIIFNIREGPDEIDVVAEIHSRSIMFELKDSEFSMGHAYPFSARISKYNPHYAVIVSTRGISSDVKEYLKPPESRRQRPIRPELKYIESLDSLPKAIEEIISGLRADYIIRTIRRISRSFDPLPSLVDFIRRRFDIPRTQDDEYWL